MGVVNLPTQPQWEEVVSLIVHSVIMVCMLIDSSREMFVRLKLLFDIEEHEPKCHVALVKIWSPSTSSTQRAAKIRPGSSSSFLKTVAILILTTTKSVLTRIREYLRTW